MKTIPTEHLDKAKEIMGEDPTIPMGYCFYGAILVYEQARKLQLAGEIDGLALVHGIGIANMPGQEGKRIAHAWVEFTRNGQITAIDPIWNKFVPADHYYEQLKVTQVLRYNYDEIVKNITKDQNIDIGPWDEEILKLGE